MWFTATIYEERWILKKSEESSRFKELKNNKKLKVNTKFYCSLSLQ